MTSWETCVLRRGDMVTLTFSDINGRKESLLVDISK